MAILDLLAGVDGLLLRATDLDRAAGAGAEVLAARRGSAA
jgi:hypothetical protein